MRSGLMYSFGLVTAATLMVIWHIWDGPMLWWFSRGDPPQYQYTFWAGKRRHH